MTPQPNIALPDIDKMAELFAPKMDAAVVEGYLAEKEYDKFFHDPLGFVEYVFCWGEGILRDEEGPDVWQAEILKELGEATKRQEEGHLNEAIREAVRSGHGIGKTTLIAWIIYWFITTREHPQIVVTANTKNQLETKTWRELAKWHKLAKNKAVFEWTATKLYKKDDRETWFASAIPWSKDRPESFAGTHEKHVLMIFDEASDIPDIIWETTEGAMTTPGAIWVVFGNPTRNTGRFKECWGKFRHRWSGRAIDSRTAKKANQIQLQAWIDDYGDDSDFVRIRVLGKFPKAATTQFIGEDVVDGAVTKRYDQLRDVWGWAPVLMGVDVARFGDDQSVIYVRQGLQTHKILTYREIDTMEFSGHIAGQIKEWKPKTVFVDSVGIGAGVCDRLRQLGFDIIYEVNAGERATKANEFVNLRAEMWQLMKDWLGAGGSIPDEEELKSDLIGVEYGFDGKSRLQLEKKKDMKSRGLASPDLADALALTFAAPVLLDEPKKGLSQAEIDWLNVTGQGESDQAFNLED